jgi:hypothetical protein
MISFRKNINKRFLTWSLVGILGSVFVLSPFLFQYFRTSQDYGFTRNIQLFSGADLKDFFIPTINKVILRKILKTTPSIHPYKKDIGLSIIALAIAVYGIAAFSRKRKGKKKKQKTKNYVFKRRFPIKGLKWLYLGIMLFIALILFIYQLSGTKNLSFFFFSLTQDNYITFFWISALGLSLYFIHRYVRLMVEEKKLFPRILFTIILLGIVAIIFSMGDDLYFFGRYYGKGPYLLIHKYIPGFSGLRVYKRFAIMAIFSLAFLAGYGTKLITERLKGPWIRNGFIIALCFLLLAEARSTAQRRHIYKFPHGQQIPRVYQWLKSIKGKKIIVEIPFIVLKEEKMKPSRINTNLYMYYSTYHWKTLLNGRSGFFPGTDIFLIHQLSFFPSFDNLYLLKKIGVDYIIDHRVEFDKKRQ